MGHLARVQLGLGPGRAGRSVRVGRDVGVTVKEPSTIPLAWANRWLPLGSGVALSKLVTVTMTLEFAGNWKSECRNTGQPTLPVIVSLRIVRLRDSAAAVDGSGEAGWGDVDGTTDGAAVGVTEAFDVGAALGVAATGDAGATAGNVQV